MYNHFKKGNEAGIGLDESNPGLIFVSYMIWGESFAISIPVTLMEDDNSHHEGGRDD